MNEGSIVELILESEEDGVFAVSLVADPAIASDFVYLSRVEDVKLAVLDEAQRLVIGAALIPNLPILRRNPDGSNYTVFFSEDTIKKISEKFLMDNNQSNITLEHREGVENITIVESWVKSHKDFDKGNLYGFQELPVGTWFLTAKINNDQIWNDFILTGEVKGFSVEAKMKRKEVQSINNYLNNSEMKKPSLFDSLKELLKNFGGSDEIVEAAAEEVVEPIEEGAPEEEAAPEVQYVTMEQLEAVIAKIAELEATIASMTEEAPAEEAEPVEEEIVEASAIVEEEVVKFVAHTDKKETVSFSMNKDHKNISHLTTAERIALNFKSA